MKEREREKFCTVLSCISDLYVTCCDYEERNEVADENLDYLEGFSLSLRVGIVLPEGPETEKHSHTLQSLHRIGYRREATLPTEQRRWLDRSAKNSSTPERVSASFSNTFPE